MVHCHRYFHSGLDTLIYRLRLSMLTRILSKSAKRLNSQQAAKVRQRKIHQLRSILWAMRIHWGNFMDWNSGYCYSAFSEIAIFLWFGFEDIAGIFIPIVYWNGLDACIFQRGVSYFGITVDAGYRRLSRIRDYRCNHPQIQINNTTPPRRKAQLPRHFSAGEQLFSGWLQYQQQPTFLFLKIIVFSSTVDYNNPIPQRSP